LHVDRVELRRVAMPLVRPFTTSFGTQSSRDVLLVRVEADGVEGWGECVAIHAPMYSSEWTDGAALVLERHLAPAVLATGDVTAAGFADLVGWVHGHRMAKAALEMALLDAEGRRDGTALADRLGAVADRVPCGVSVGMEASVGAVVDAVDAYVAEGYRRIKLKVQPGFDLDLLAAVRDAHPDVPLQVDANTAYTLDDADHLAGLDAFDLLLVEQPFAEDRLGDHARLAQRLATPVCLDESITSEAVCVDAIAMGATSVVNLKAGRVGGVLAARHLADVCAAREVPVWCGGMVETGIGRAANVALAACPNFSLVGDVSASDRFWAQDLVARPFVMDDGHLPVPTGPGLGVEVDTAFLDHITTDRQVLTRT
jgi:O-succinylbenzoate synthase